MTIYSKYNLGFNIGHHPQTHNTNLKGFQGQETDDEVKGEGNSVNYKYRMHDARIGRFFAVDPKESEYSSVNPYIFVLNSPIRFIEVDGLNPGDPFSTIQAAIADYANVIGRMSIEGNTEYRSLIYVYKNEDGEKRYSYTVPASGGSSNVKAEIIPKDANIGVGNVVAGIHSHSASSAENNSFDNHSFQDADNSNRADLPEYITTPSGKIMLYKPGSYYPKKSELESEYNNGIAGDPVKELESVAPYDIRSEENNGSDNSVFTFDEVTNNNGERKLESEMKSIYKKNKKVNKKKLKTMAGEFGIKATKNNKTYEENITN